MKKRILVLSVCGAVALLQAMTVRAGSDPNADPDMDGFSNQIETELGTSPLDPASRPTLADNCGKIIAYWPLTQNAMAAVGPVNGLLRNGARFQNGALKLDGKDDYVNFGSGLSVTGDLSYCIWFQMDKWSGLRHVLGKFQSADHRREYSAFIGPERRLWTYFSDDGSCMLQHSLLQVTRFQAVKIPAWQHLAVSWQSALGADGVRVYIGGVAQPLCGLSQGDIRSIHNGGANLTLGAYDMFLPCRGKNKQPKEVVRNSFDGSMAQLVLCNGALTDLEVREIFRLGRGGNLRAWLDLDSDGDDWPDRLERRHFGDIRETPDGDADGDGLSNAEELLLGTDPLNPDTDGDTMPDGWEVANGFDPLNSSDANRDADGDNLVNSGEFTRHTDPRNPDTDGDGFDDGTEASGGSDPLNPDSIPGVKVCGQVIYNGPQTGTVYAVLTAFSNEWRSSAEAVLSGPGQYELGNVRPGPDSLWLKAWMDTDGNGSNDSWEAWGVYTNNPLVLTSNTARLDVVLLDPDADVDDDGLPDAWEKEWLHGLGRNADDDADGDGLSNRQEYETGTDPDRRDSDTDGLPDGWEADHGLNPGDPTDFIGDPDGDGLSNEQEYFYGTDPNRADTDSDGFSDPVEISNGSNPLDPDSVPFASLGGTVLYKGIQNGAVYVLAVPADGSNAWNSIWSTVLSNAGPYTVSSVPTARNYDLKAFLDTDGNGIYTAGEPAGSFAFSNMLVLGCMTNLDFQIAEPDSDGDGMTDVWETANHLNPYDSSDAQDDPDGDGIPNLQEFTAGENPFDGREPLADVYIALTGAHIPPFSSWATAATNIQAALDAAQPGDVVMAAGGIYSGEGNRNIRFNGKAVTLCSQHGSWQSIIDCEYTARGFIFDGGETNDSVLAGFTIWRGQIPADGETSAFGGGIFCSNASPRIAGCRLLENDGNYGRGSAVSCTAGSAAVITDCQFEYNFSSQEGAVCVEESSPVIENCRFSWNSSTRFSSGGGLFLRNSGFTARNCILDENVAFGGGGMWCENSTGTIQNCTFYRNCAYVIGGVGVSNGENLPVDVANCIFSENDALSGIPDIQFDDPNIRVAHSCIRGIWEENGNIDADPLLCAELSLEETSPCIDAGTDKGSAATDMKGSLRRDHPGHVNVASTVDMGALEFVPQTDDLDGDGMPDVWERRYSLSAITDDSAEDADGDGLSNLAEYRAGTHPFRADTDGDLLPDLWEVQNGLNPLSKMDAYSDSDADGVNALYEFLRGTDPNDTVSAPTVAFFVDAAASPGGDGSFNAPFASIQDALDAADEFDMVQVAPGRYTNSVDFGGKAVFVRARPGYERAVIEGAVRFSRAEDRTSALSGFLLRDAGVVCRLSRPLIQRCIFTPGSRLSYETSEPLLLNCTLLGKETLVFSGGNKTPQLCGSIYRNGFDPLLTPDGRLRAGSPCIDAAPQEPVLTDMEGEFPVDIPGHGASGLLMDTGADEFTDGDGDRLPDAWEQHIFGNLSATGSGDADGDGLDNQGEYEPGCDPFNPDSDGDGLTDGAEVNMHGTDPLHPDTDRDLMPDVWEVRYGLNPLDVMDACADADGDRIDNVYEWHYGTDLTDPASAPAPTLFVNAAAALGGDGSVTAPFKTLKAALDAASEYAVIDVAPGRYTGPENRNLSLSKPVLLRGAGCGYDKPVIDCEHHYTAIWFVSGADLRTVLDGFIIENGGQFGALSLMAGSDFGPVVRNCVVTRSGREPVNNGFYNESGAVFCFWRGSQLIENCTIVDNPSSGVTAAGGAWPMLRNCIVRGNQYGAFCGVGTNRVTYCNLQENFPGEGNFNLDPLLDRDFRLTAASPCIDAGTLSAVRHDGDGEYRWDDPAHSNHVSSADIGADEWIDTDADGLRDSWELLFFGTLTHDMQADDDGDGLLNYEEYNAGTSPITSDTDGDGLSDGAEFRTHATDLCRSDTDLDGLSDSFELGHGFDPLNVHDSMRDDDGDGFGFIYEYRHGTDPADALSFPVPTVWLEPTGELTIQAAIDAAAEYDVIGLKAGAYGGAGNRKVSFYGKAVMLLGDAAVMDLSAGRERGFVFEYEERPQTVVSGITIRNGYAQYGGGIYCRESSPTIRNCRVLDCEGNLMAPMGVFASDQIKIFRKTHPTAGGAVYCERSGAVFENCLFGGNSADYGGAVYCERSSALFRNCTITGNRAEHYGAFCLSSSPETGIMNSIVWNNGTGTVLGGSFSFCVLQESRSGAGNRMLDPQLAGNFYLRPGSPCIDAAGSDAPARDLAGHPRWDNPAVSNAASYADIGAYEYADTDGDGLPDDWEFERFGNLSSAATGDADADGATNLAEFQAGTDPHKADSDNDGLSDGEESSAGLNPICADTDGDGLTDGDELYADGSHGDTDGFVTSPLNPDTDGDSIPDSADEDPTDPLVPAITWTVSAPAEAQAGQMFEITVTAAPPIADGWADLDMAGGGQLVGASGDVRCNGTSTVVRVHVLDGKFTGKILALKPGRIELSARRPDMEPARSSNALVRAKTPFQSAAWYGRRVLFPEGAAAVTFDVAAAARQIGGTVDTNIVWTVAGLPLTTITIGRDGYAFLGSEALSALPATAAEGPSGLLAPCMTALVFKPESRVCIDWLWGQREPCFTVEWTHMGRAEDSAADLSFQLRLYPHSGRSDFVYRELLVSNGTPLTVSMNFGTNGCYAWTNGFENLFGLELGNAAADATVLVVPNDFDGDGLTTAKEIELGTHPDRIDTDGDGLTDGWESDYSAAANSLIADADNDFDGDGLSNRIEYWLGSNPEDPASPEQTDPDTDRDGMPDVWETANGLNPNDATDALSDNDHDGYCNVLEFAAGGDPNDPSGHGIHPCEPRGSGVMKSLSITSPSGVSGGATRSSEESGEESEVNSRFYGVSGFAEPGSSSFAGRRVELKARRLQLVTDQMEFSEENWIGYPSAGGVQEWLPDTRAYARDGNSLVIEPGGEGPVFIFGTGKPYYLYRTNMVFDMEIETHPDWGVFINRRAGNFRERIMDENRAYYCSREHMVERKERGADGEIVWKKENVPYYMYWFEAAAPLVTNILFVKESGRQAAPVGKTCIATGEWVNVFAELIPNRPEYGIAVTWAKGSEECFPEHRIGGQVQMRWKEPGTPVVSASAGSDHIYCGSLAVCAATVETNASQLIVDSTLATNGVSLVTLLEPGLEPEAVKGECTLKIVTQQGGSVRTLVDREERTGGTAYTDIWDGLDSAGNAVPAGCYRLKLQWEPGVGDTPPHRARCTDERELVLAKVDIEQAETNVCCQMTSATLNLTADSCGGSGPNSVIWTNIPEGLSNVVISADCMTFTFNPSNSLPGEYEVAAWARQLTNCYDTCTVRVLKVDIEQAETNVCLTMTNATLNLTADSYWGGGSNSVVWTNIPEGLSDVVVSEDCKSFTFNPSNSVPGEYEIMVWASLLTNCFDTCTVRFLKIDIFPDWNHDRTIDRTDQNQNTNNAPFRFWINDDNDSGDISEGDSDLPGQGGGWFGLEHANYKDDVVNGRSDLPDFFPVWLDIGPALDSYPPGSGVEYRLSQANDALKFVYTDLINTNAGDYLISTNVSSCGSNFNQNACAADTILITSSGTELSAEFLRRVAENPNKGVILIEGVATSTVPLILEASSNGTVVAHAELPLSISGVENMYRWINLRHVPLAKEERNTNTNQPANYPDSLCENGKHFVFVHGFNVSEKQARGWNSEVFKRLYQSGSRAMYTAVTWQGDEISGFLPAEEPYYHADVINAFQTASSLAVAVAALPGQKYVAAHSLGNMVVSAAIRDHGLNPVKYFMIDAAVAMEAYKSSDTTNALDIAEAPWTEYTNRLWASEWYKLFDESDGRNRLTWRGRFGNIPQAINYYSSGEDVLNNNTNHESMSLLNTHSAEHSWIFQEKIKGGALPAVLWGIDSQGGWGFNSHYNEYLVFTMPPDQAALLTDDQIRTNSFFKPFYEDGLYGVDGSTVASNLNVRAKVLAEAIPATSRATGRNALDVWGDSRNIDLMLKKSGWPPERITLKDSEGRWFHSDSKNVAYLYVYKFFDDMAGGLK